MSNDNDPTPPKQSPEPEHEPGGGKFLLIVAAIVLSSLAGTVWVAVKKVGGPAPGHQPPAAAPHSSRE